MPMTKPPARARCAWRIVEGEAGILRQASRGIDRRHRASRIEVVIVMSCAVPEAPRLVYVARDLRRKHRGPDMAGRIHRSGNTFYEIRMGLIARRRFLS